MQSDGMESNWAAENLQTIRTLMERSALYRRALAPVMSFAGAVGILAAFVGILLHVECAFAFIGYWLGVAIVGLMGAFFLVRRQALKSSEPFWSPPTRRVATALLPCLTAGFVLGVWFFMVSLRPLDGDPLTGTVGDHSMLLSLVTIWTIFYGCALHAAGFYTLRGIRLLGWLFIAAGIAIMFMVIAGQRQDFPLGIFQVAHCLMGSLFGLLQLAYGIYLYFTEKRGNES
ncbi:MAG: hypothetical protein U1F83_11800 [Verrucomicrobiota bacterium]